MSQEPTITDVLNSLKSFQVDFTNLRADVATLRADLATFRLDTVTRLGTLFDEVAAFRAEYNQHTHEEPE